MPNTTHESSQQVVQNDASQSATSQVDNPDNSVGREILTGFWRDRAHPQQHIVQIMDGLKVVFVSDPHDTHRLTAIDLLNHQSVKLAFVAQSPGGCIVQSCYGVTRSEFIHFINIVRTHIDSEHIEREVAEGYRWDQQVLVETRELVAQAEYLTTHLEHD